MKARWNCRTRPGHWPDFVFYPVKGNPQACQIWVWNDSTLAERLVALLNKNKIRPDKG